MPSLNRRIKLFLVIALPIAAASIFLLFNTFRDLERTASSIDLNEANRNRQAVSSAFASLQDRFAGMISDNAHWDDAAEQSYGQIDEPWMYETWGASTNDTNYDTMMLLDSSGELIIGYHKGARKEMSAADYTGGRIEGIIRSLPYSPSAFSSVGTLVQTPYGISVIGVAPVLPLSKDIALPPGRPRILILGQAISEAMLDRISRQYGVDGLQLSALTSDMEPENILRDHLGQPVAGVTWSMSTPGDAVRNSYRTSAIATVLAILGVVIPIAFVHFRTLANIEIKDKQDFEVARHDALSRLPNQLLFNEALTHLLANALPGELAIVHLRLDSFNAINDAYGRAIGDKLLLAVAGRLTDTLTGYGILARIAGDEFAVAVSSAHARDHAGLVASAMLEQFKQPFSIDGRIISIKSNIGISVYTDSPVDLQEFLRQSNIALTEAEDNGPGQFRYFDPQADRRHSLDIEIASELGRIIADDAIEVAYQPIVDADTLKLVAVEALARWPSDEPVVYPPDRFIPVAERHDRIDQLGRQIFEKACRDIAPVPQIRVAINLSALQISNQHLTQELVAIAGSYRMPLSRIELEFTESVLIKNKDRAKALIRELRQLGITVALDDFGTGFASIGYLREFEFDKIKLDRTLTQRMAEDEASRRFVSGTVTIARGLSSTLLAEGVETAIEAQTMRNVGCQEFQGFFFGRPQSIEDIKKKLAEQREA